MLGKIAETIFSVTSLVLCILLFLIAASAVGAGYDEDEACRARACLASPYGTGHVSGMWRADRATPGTDRRRRRAAGVRVAGRRRGLQHRTVLARDGVAPVRRRRGAFGKIRLKCGTYLVESLPEFVAFEPGSDTTLTAAGAAKLAGIEAALGGRTFSHLRLVGVWESRGGYADELLARHRAAVVRDGLAARLAGLEVSLEGRATNYVAGRGLRHGVFITVAGRGVAPDRTLLGQARSERSRCGLWAARAGSLREVVEASLGDCGLQIRVWIEREGQSVDFLLPTAGIRRVGDSPEELLGFIEEQYGLVGSIDEIDVDFRIRPR